jgi:hypothetical protein
MELVIPTSIAWKGLGRCIIGSESETVYFPNSARCVTFQDFASMDSVVCGQGYLTLNDERQSESLQSLGCLSDVVASPPLRYPKLKLQNQKHHKLKIAVSWVAPKMNSDPGGKVASISHEWEG